MKAKIVVGLGYGDEGKGITTDYLSSSQAIDKSIVLRYSGGQQAGHTVKVGDKKHIFSNFCSGSIRGLESYFSEYTTVYPTTISRELKILKLKGISPKLTIHPLAKLTTPYDVFSNRDDDANLNHGTCGLGIGKTMKRNEGTYKLYAVDLLHHETLDRKIDKIAREYYGYDDSYPFSQNQKDEIEDFIEAVNSLDWNIKDYSYLKSFDNLILEGSQGILLDMDHGVFPHVTYANTTTKNAHLLLDKLGITDREVFYITRSYLTRHGNGPFEEQKLNLKNTEEEINVTNRWQKNFKVAKPNYDLLKYSLALDSSFSSNYPRNLVVTCMDQYEDFDYKKLEFKFDEVYYSTSPDSKDFKKVE